HIADTVLTERAFQQMNATELFVLAAALYSHDWGMAVNEVERVYITEGKLPPNIPPQELWTLPDEQETFRRFVTERHQQQFEEPIPTVEWREYVRTTHAIRSSERVRRFFEEYPGVGEAVARVCEGHSLDFEDLDDFDSYPTNYAILRETVNLRALAIYLRLIDLLDLA